MKISLLEAARVVRTKNSGPYELTVDVMFKDRPTFELFRDKKLIDARLVAEAYGIDVSDVCSVVWFEPANAVKATMRRLIVSGGPGDTDVYGAQQHGPLLGLEWEI